MNCIFTGRTKGTPCIRLCGMVLWRDLKPGENPGVNCRVSCPNKGERIAERKVLISGICKGKRRVTSIEVPIYSCREFGQCTTANLCDKEAISVRFAGDEYPPATCQDCEVGVELIRAAQLSRASNLECESQSKTEH